MNAFVSSKISTIAALMIAVYLAYYLLLRDNFLHCTITSIIHYTAHLSIKEHLIVLGLLPIYIAMMIFGAAILGIYLGSRIEYLLVPVDKNE